MNYAHVGHDSHIGNRCILANSSALAGHVTLEDYVFVGGLAAIHQFVRIGESALLGGGAMVTGTTCRRSATRRETVPGSAGSTSSASRRRGFTAERIRELKRGYRVIFGSKVPLAEARAQAMATLGEGGDVGRILAFVAASKRGLCPAGRAGGTGNDDGDA